MYMIARLTIIAFLGLALTGCIAAAVGAGAAGGYYFEKHYHVVKKSQKSEKTAGKKYKEKE